MSGWEPPTPGSDGSPRRSHWTQASDPDPLGPGQLIRRAWRLYRTNPRRFLLVASGPELARAVLAIPSLAITLGFVEGMIRLFGDYLAAAAADPEAYRANPGALQAELEAQLRAILVPLPDVATMTVVAGAASVVVGLVGTCVLTAAALEAASGLPISFGGVFRRVAARSGLIWPIVAIGLGWLAVTWVPLLLQGSPEFQAWAGQPGSPRSVLLASLLSTLAAVVFVFVVVLAVRWALYVPAVVAESLGIGRGLVRAARLSRGIRIRLGLAMIGVLLMRALSVGITALFVGIVAGISAGSVAIGFAAYLATSLVAELLWAPVMPSMLAAAYQSRAGG